ncbi:peroxidasin homolog isoform X2 [Eurytemora carolleeae]|uniref:peroxidasin homolog isoform X1 n=1 Tax=Eurytemora carolleeae TaxID=1294199 RepID=UPI000C784420|nr:peroxidasin homolog isoform X1 [Eurytemora carolleeae]XP_023320820.1 peroxidasin homolog isoform X2 [Eurytemora carolleeae]|eukprot:XP_023320819.1 peroxidasin homolog isoform X1 [Eurytemora affinis]
MVPGRMMKSVFGLLFLVLPQRNLGVTRILEGPKDISTTEGGTAIFKCSFWSPSSARVFWTFNENLVQLTDNARQYTASAEEKRDENSQQTQILEDGTLVLRNVAQSAAGVYACTVVDEDSLERIVSAPAILNVEGRTEKPRISHRPVKTTVHIGELIVLDCLASGYPPPFYTWYKDGGRLSAAHDRFTLAENGSLIISNAQLDDSARYRCSASNYLGKATSSVKVQVENLDPPSPPQITTRPRNRSVQEGGIIEMTCVAQGSPYPTVTWWNNRRLVTANSRVTLSNGGQHLRIQDIEIYDQGDYSCVAENIHGKEQIVSFIRVQPDPNRREQSQWRFTTTETPRTSRVTPANTSRNRMEVLGATLGITGLPAKDKTGKTTFKFI